MISKFAIDESNITFRKRDKNAVKECHEIDIEEECDPDALPIIELIGDSMLNLINVKGISKNAASKVCNFSGLTSEDLKDFVNPSIRRKPQVLVVHVGTNDINKGSETIENLQNIVNRVKRKSSSTKIIISSVVKRLDKPKMEEKVTNLNPELKLFAK